MTPAHAQERGNRRYAQGRFERDGRYELRGDGVSVPYYWVWIPAAVVVAPPPPPPGG